MLPPNTPSLELSLRDVIVCHKETQTDTATLIDSYTATAPVNRDDKGSLKVFDFSEAVQDPKLPRNVTIIQDVYAEDIHSNDNPGGSIDESTANRDRYCREVIKPYLKDYPKNCPISDDQLIRDALEAADEDYPDYEPCFETYDGKQEISDKKDNSPLNSKDSIRSSLLINDFESSACQRGKHIQSDISKTNISRISTLTNLNSNMDQQKEGCPEKVKPKGCTKDKSKPGCPTPIETCKGEASWPPPEPPSACNPNSVENTPRCADRVPSAGATKEIPVASPNKGKNCEKQKSDMSSIKQKFGMESDSSITLPKQKTMMEAHSETIATIKTAVEDFFGKVYKTTKDAVTIIKTESAKHLGRMTAKKSGSNTDIIPQRVHENKSSDTITSYNYYRSTDNTDSKSQSTNNDDADDNLTNAGQVIGKIFAKVDSTISILSDHIDLQKVKSMLTFEDFSNRKSPYDIIKPEEEEEEEEAVSTSNIGPNSVFAAIKTRIASMFSDGESGVKESESKESSNTGANSKKTRR